MEALHIPRDRLIADPRWLIDALAVVVSPMPGDVVCYERTPSDLGASLPERVWHLMLYEGNGRVIGACDVQRRVIVRAFDFKAVARRVGVLSSGRRIVRSL